MISGVEGTRGKEDFVAGYIGPRNANSLVSKLRPVQPDGLVYLSWSRG